MRKKVPTMPNYKLVYFNGRGRAEPARYVFAQAGVEYEDVRLTPEEFGARKATFPAGSLPVLEEDGKMLSGSGVITRYLAENLGVAGSSEFDNAQIASVVDTVSDLYKCIKPVYFNKDDAAKAEAKEKLLKESVPKHLGSLEKRISANGSADGWAYGTKITYADIYISLLKDTIGRIDSDAPTGYPAVCKCAAAVRAQPKIAEWIKKRPDTPF